MLGCLQTLLNRLQMQYADASPCIVEADRSAVSARPARKSADSRLSLGLRRMPLPLAAMLSASDMLLLRLRASLPEAPTCSDAGRRAPPSVVMDAKCKSDNNQLCLETMQDWKTMRNITIDMPSASEVASSCP
jgi:hypothetical protein